MYVIFHDFYSLILIIHLKKYIILIVNFYI